MEIAKSFQGSEAIQCPKCQEDYLHHSSIEVFDRDKEDSESGRHVVVNDSKVQVDGDISHNPSGRRGGLLVACRCENCDVISLLAIVQHKGQTFVYWQE